MLLVPDGDAHKLHKAFEDLLNDAVTRTVATAVLVKLVEACEANDAERRKLPQLYVLLENGVFSVYVPWPPLEKRPPAVKTHQAFVVFFGNPIEVDFLSWEGDGDRNLRAMQAVGPVALQALGMADLKTATEALLDVWSTVADAVAEPAPVFRAVEKLDDWLPPEPCPLHGDDEPRVEEIKDALHMRSPRHTLAMVLALAHGKVPNDWIAVQAMCAALRLVFRHTSFSSRVLQAFPNLAPNADNFKQKTNTFKQRTRRFILDIAKTIFALRRPTKSLTEAERVRLAAAEQYFRLRRCPVCPDPVNSMSETRTR